MNKRTIYEQRKRDRDRLLKIKDLQEKQNKILSQIKKSKVVEKSNPNLG